MDLRERDRAAATVELVAHDWPPVPQGCHSQVVSNGVDLEVESGSAASVASQGLHRRSGTAARLRPRDREPHAGREVMPAEPPALGTRPYGHRALR